MAGLVLSGSLTLAYSKFYDALGLRSADVGFTYASVLPTAAGLAVTFAAVLAASAAVAYWRAWHLIATFIAVAVLFFTGISLWQVEKVNSRITAVRHGEPVAESRLGPFVFLSLHAEPVTLTAADPSKPGPALPVRPDRPLLLLGQANALVVVYDSLLEQAVYLPAGSVIVHATSCRSPATTKSGDPAFTAACQRLQA
ncbi:MAG TPA: hypothetical protein VLR26_02280 [Frankiaceae bacterium]|nr:hypothetical protein [Frankiaceae bacterium]